MSIVERVDAYQRKHPAVSFPLAVVYKFFDDSGPYLAALITYYGFLAIFPLLLLASTILGKVLKGNPELQQQLLDSAVGQFPLVVARLLQDPRQLGDGTAGLVVGVLVALYGGLGFGMALQHAVNTVWAVPRNSRPNPFKARGRALLLLATVGLGVLGAAALSAVANGLGGVGTTVVLLATVGAVAVNTAVLTLGLHIAAAIRQPLRQTLPGALVAAVVWQVLQTFGATYVNSVVRNASTANSVFAVVLGLIAFIHLASIALVMCVQLNVVRSRRLHPRALLTPLTDAVQLTEGDERVYRDQAKAARLKGFERIDVTFNKRRGKDDDEREG